MFIFFYRGYDVKLQKFSVLLLILPLYCFCSKNDHKLPKKMCCPSNTHYGFCVSQVMVATFKLEKR